MRRSTKGGDELRSAFALGVLALAIGCAKGGEGPSGFTSYGSGSVGSASAEGGSESGSDESEGEGDTGEQGGVCLLHNCDEDLECAGCTEGRTTCLVEEKRCIACDPESGEGCADGEMCSEFGYCVPEGLTCETDAEGEPTIECDSDADCAACDPQHLV